VRYPAFCWRIGDKMFRSKKKVDFSPPTEEELKKRKVYGGGSANIPPSQIRGKKGWFGDYERHSDVARESWATRKDQRITPESTKDTKVMQHLAGKYDKAYDVKRKDIEDLQKDVSVLSEASKVETRYIKEDEKLRQQGIKESLEVEQAKTDLEHKIRKYEDKQDDKLQKEVEDEIRVKEQREAREKEYQEQMKSAKEVLEEYKRLESSAEARAKEERAREERIKQREEEKLKIQEARIKTREVNKLTSDRNNLQLKLNREESKLSDLERQRDQKEDQYKKKVDFVKKEYEGATSEDVERLTKAEKDAVEQLNSRIETQNDTIKETQDKIVDVNGKLEDLVGKKETAKIPEVSKFKEIEKKYAYKPKEVEEKKKEYEKAPDWFINKDKRKSRDEAWDSMPDNLKQRLTDKYKTIEKEEKKPPSDVPPDWFEPNERDKEWRKELWNAQTNEQKERLITKYSNQGGAASKKYDLRPMPRDTENMNQDLLKRAQYDNRTKPHIANKLKIGSALWNDLQYAEPVYVNDYIDAVERNDPDGISLSMNDLTANVDKNKAKYKNTGNEEFRPGLVQD